MKFIVLKSGDLSLSLRPDIGGCIEGFWFKDHPVLRSSAPGSLVQVRNSASYPLVPYSNRVAKAQLQWAGTSHPLVRNFGDEAHAIHGVGWQRPWQVLEATDDFAMLSLEHSADRDWPFAFDASQTFRIKNNTLEMTMSITNQSSGDAPVGLGWHPYFMKPAGTQLAFAAKGLWQMGGDKLPTSLQPSTGLHQVCDALNIDNCFDGWGGSATLRNAQWTAQLTSNLQRLVVFTTPDKDFIAIEPVSHVNNAMNSQGNPKELGVVVLGAGQSYQVSMSIAVQANPQPNL